MGDHYHRAIAVVGGQEGDRHTNIHEARAVAHSYGLRVTEVVPACNGYGSFMVAPHGYKAGGLPEEGMDQATKRFKEWLVAEDQLHEYDWFDAGQVERDWRLNDSIQDEIQRRDIAAGDQAPITELFRFWEVSQQLRAAQQRILKNKGVGWISVEEDGGDVEIGFNYGEYTWELDEAERHAWEILALVAEARSEGKS